MAVNAPICNFGWKAPDFELPATDGQTYRLEDIKGENGTVIMFICNHCPYVRSIIDRIVRDMKDLESLGVRAVAICANDAEIVPDDSFEKMETFAEQNGFSFPYLHDREQTVAKAYGAVCTPDFFGFNRDLELQYRGRLDESGKNPAQPDCRRELYEAMRDIARSGSGPEEQIPSMGCSIKWKAA